MGINISEFFDRQLQVWDTARNNFEALKNVKVKEFNVDGTTIKVQFNPGRIVSSAAKVDAKSLKERCPIDDPYDFLKFPFFLAPKIN